MKTFLTILITTIAVATTTWFLSSWKSTQSEETNGKKPLYYQSAMHPWIKSDRPGRCTICGMELTPVYPGDQGFDNTGGENVIALSQSQIRVVNVATVAARVEPLVRHLEVAGMIDDDARRHQIISAYVDGRIDELHVNFMGAEVEKGQVLAEFYSPSLLQAEREYRQFKGELGKGAAIRLKQMGLSPEQIKAVNNKPDDVLTTQILAPKSGTVVERYVYEGQYVQTGERLFEIADFSIMWFLFDGYEQDLRWFSLGQEVKVTTPSQPGKTYAGKINFIDPNFNEQTRSTKIRVELLNPVIEGRRELLHKLYADGLVEMETAPVLLIPKSAVMQTGPKAVVYIDRDGGAYEQVAVELGRRGDTQVEILSGLSAGDKVVTNGLLLIDGQAEMNRAFATPEEEKKAPPPTPLAPLTLDSDQITAIKDFITTADAMAAKLAADDLKNFNQSAELAMPKTVALVAALQKTSVSPNDLKSLSEASHFHGFDSLLSARTAFLKFSMAVSTVLQPLRGEKFPVFQVFECPMVDQAIPGAAKKGRWLQVIDRPIGNPYFGAEMLACGIEIKP